MRYRLQWFIQRWTQGLGNGDEHPTIRCCMDCCILYLRLLGQLSLLPSAEREMSTGQSAVMLCAWGLKAGMVHSTCG